MKAATTDFFNGCLFFPFICLLSLPILVWAAPYVATKNLSEVVTALVSSNRGSLALAGGAGLFFVLGEFFNFD